MKKYLIVKSCAPEAGIKGNGDKLTEPEMQAWMDDNIIAYERSLRIIPPVIKSLKQRPGDRFAGNGTEYLLIKKDPEPYSLCQTANDCKPKVYWYININLQELRYCGKQFFVPEEGR